MSLFQIFNKKILWMVVVLATLSIHLFGDVTPHLILYFDINKTLIASDKAGNKSVSDVLNELLAEKYEAQWDVTTPKMSFEMYVYDVLVPGSSLHDNVYQERKYHVQHFVDYLREKAHPLYQTVLQDYNSLLASLNQSSGMVFPSFYHLLEHLDKAKISYSIILRSFGDETVDVAKEVNKIYKKIFRSLGEFRGEQLVFNGKLIEGTDSIYQLLRRVEHAAIHDDWKHWNGHGMTAKHGKPFYVDREDPKTLSIFFDDNIKNDLVHNIVAPLDAKTGELISIEELIESGQAVRVDTLKAIQEPNYFIDRVQEALDKKG